MICGILYYACLNQFDLAYLGHALKISIEVIVESENVYSLNGNAKEVCFNRI